MSEQLINELTDILITPARINELSDLCDGLYRMVLESLQNGLARETKREISDFYNQEDWLAERLGVSDTEDPLGTARYYFGQIKAVADILSDAAAWETERQEALELSKRFKYLPKCLEAIDRHELISGQELKRELDMKDSGFANFVRRVEEYHLFYIQKSGNNNYYSLTPRGRRCLLQNTVVQDARHTCSLTFLVSLLEQLALELEAGGRDADKVLLEANLRCEGGRLQGYDRQVRKAVERSLRAEEVRRKKRLADNYRAILWAGLNEVCPEEVEYQMIEDVEFAPA